MKLQFSLTSARTHALLALTSVSLSGCLVTTHRFPIPIAPAITQTVAADELVAQLNKRWSSFDTLNATVDIRASQLKTKEGVAKDFTSFRGHILMRKPQMLRVLGQYPIIGGRMFDLASDGKNFTLYIPPRGKAIEGTNEVRKRSTKFEENLRPGSFFDAMMVRGLEPGDLYMVRADTETMVDASKMQLLLTPEYILSVMRHKQAEQELAPVRVVHIHREDLLPYQQDLYDVDGNLETQVFYGKYQKTGDQLYPSVVTIKRPLEEYQLVLTVEKVIENMPLTDDQFQFKVPEGTTIQRLDPVVTPPSAEPAAAVTVSPSASPIPASPLPASP